MSVQSSGAARALHSHFGRLREMNARLKFAVLHASVTDLDSRDAIFVVNAGVIKMRAENQSAFGALPETFVLSARIAAVRASLFLQSTRHPQFA
jgi:hypothetical protein